jgi:hypothetical protein
MVDGIEVVGSETQAQVTPVATAPATPQPGTQKVQEEVRIGQIIRELGYITAKYCGRGSGRVEPGQAFAKGEAIYACRPNAPDKAIFFVVRDKYDPNEFGINQYEKYFAEEDRVSTNLLAIKIQDELKKNVAFGFDANREIQRLAQMQAGLGVNATTTGPEIITGNPTMVQEAVVGEVLQPPEPVGTVNVGRETPATVQPITVTPVAGVVNTLPRTHGVIKFFEERNAWHVHVNNRWIPCSEALVRDQNLKMLRPESNILDVSTDGLYTEGNMKFKRSYPAYDPRNIMWKVSRTDKAIISFEVVVVNNGVAYYDFSDFPTNSQFPVANSFIPISRCTDNNGHCLVKIEDTVFDISASQTARTECLKMANRIVEKAIDRYLDGVKNSTGGFLFAPSKRSTFLKNNPEAEVVERYLPDEVLSSM